MVRSLINILRRESLKLFVGMPHPRFHTRSILISKDQKSEERQCFGSHFSYRLESNTCKNYVRTQMPISQNNRCRFHHLVSEDEHDSERFKSIADVNKTLVLAKLEKQNAEFAKKNLKRRKREFKM